MTMRNRKTIITAFVLAACLLIGVGYAVLSDSLRIDGSVSIDHAEVNKAFDSLVYFESATVVADNQGTALSGTTTDTASVSATEGTENDVAVIGVHSPKFEGDKAYFKIVIKNNYTESVFVKPVIDTASGIFDSSLIKVTSNWTNNEGTGVIHEIAAGESIEYILTVTLLKTIESGVANTSFAIGMDASDTLSAVVKTGDTQYVDAAGATKTIPTN